MSGSSGRSPTGWRIEERVGSAAELHAGWTSVEGRPIERAVAMCRPTGAAAVLGSTQSYDVVSRSRASAVGLAVIRRRSGGGAVLVTPADPVWIDVWVPVGDRLWSADVIAAFGWLGEVWRTALVRLGLSGVEVQGATPGACTRWSTLVCFGGVGAGEVSVDGRKTVGLAQRRSRHGAWFHGACVMQWNPGGFVTMLNLDGVARKAAAVELAGAATGVEDAAAAQGLLPAPTADALRSAFISSLP